MFHLTMLHSQLDLPRLVILEAVERKLLELKAMRASMITGTDAAEDMDERLEAMMHLRTALRAESDELFALTVYPTPTVRELTTAGDSGTSFAGMLPGGLCS
jgi:hypothetical protein